MTDIAPELYEKLKSEYEKKLQNDKKLRMLQIKINDKTADYADAAEYAERSGRLLSEVIGENISSAILPDGKMYYNIAERTLSPMIDGNYDVVVKACSKVQEQLNENAGIGMKAVVPQQNTDRRDGIIEMVTKADLFDDVAEELKDVIINIAQSVCDDFVRENADFQYKSGMSPKIVRKSSGRCCEWCKALVGTYDYEDVEDGSDVFRRHNRCRCTVEYIPNKHERQNVWTKEVKRIEIKEEKADAGRRGIDIKSEYIRTARPGTGTITVEDGYKEKEHVDEINMAEWIHNNLGGDIKLLKETESEKRADYLWREKYWDLKTCSSEKAANSAIRYGLKQIHSNPGGILLNYGNIRYNEEKLKEMIEKRMQWYKSYNLDILIVSQNKLSMAIRYGEK